MPRSTPPCGTDRAYHRHYRLSQTPCDPCREAHLAANRARYRAKRDAAAAAPMCACSPCCCDQGGTHCRQAGCPVCITTQITETETAVTPEDYCTGTHECGCDDCERHWADLADIDGETPDGEPLNA
ncbi:hypothetical protein [Nocardiopsis protaetiae]|uniref:hypothetical protein n=1 Tax=Nocardiopsis protaetiae TaxID=3382270 RepID=UPI00387AD0C3